MGKGDRKTKRGKIWRGSNGKARPKPGKKNKSLATTTEAKEKS